MQRRPCRPVTNRSGRFSPSQLLQGFSFMRITEKVEDLRSSAFAAWESTDDVGLTPHLEAEKVSDDFEARLRSRSKGLLSSHACILQTPDVSGRA
jgi:hypothetical protein